MTPDRRTDGWDATIASAGVSVFQKRDYDAPFPRKFNSGLCVLKQAINTAAAVKDKSVSLLPCRFYWCGEDGRARMNARKNSAQKECGQKDTPDATQTTQHPRCPRSTHLYHGKQASVHLRKLIWQESKQVFSGWRGSLSASAGDIPVGCPSMLW